MVPSRCGTWVHKVAPVAPGATQSCGWQSRKSVTYPAGTNPPGTSLLVHILSLLHTEASSRSPPMIPTVSSLWGPGGHAGSSQLQWTAEGWRQSVRCLGRHRCLQSGHRVSFSGGPSPSNLPDPAYHRPTTALQAGPQGGTVASWEPRHSLNMLRWALVPSAPNPWCVLILSPLIPPCPSPSHQIQRPKEEVHQLSRTGVLDMLLQLCLGVERSSR